MKKILNVLMVMFLAVAALTLTFAITLPGSKTSGASVSVTSAMPSAVNVSTAAEFDAVRPAFANVNYLTSEGDFNRGLMPVMVNQFAAIERNRRLPNYKFAPKRSLFDTPLFTNSKTLKQPPIFSQPQNRFSPLRR